MSTEDHKQHAFPDDIPRARIADHAVRGNIAIGLLTGEGSFMTIVFTFTAAYVAYLLWGARVPFRSSASTATNGTIPIVPDIYGVVNLMFHSFLAFSIFLTQKILRDSKWNTLVNSQGPSSVSPVHFASAWTLAPWVLAALMGFIAIRLRDEIIVVDALGQVFMTFGMALSVSTITRNRDDGQTLSGEKR